MPLPRELLERLLERRNLAEAEAEALVTHLTNAETPPAFSGAVLAALRSKGVVADEIRKQASIPRRIRNRLQSKRNCHHVQWRRQPTQRGERKLFLYFPLHRPHL